MVGMGTHWQYGKCGSQYQFTVVYDANNFLVGVVNAVNLDRTLANAPEQIEIVPAMKLLGLVFSETRFDPWFNLSQPRMLIHVYLRKPDMEFQSCSLPIEKTPMNNQGLRCNLCWETLESAQRHLRQSKIFKGMLLCNGSPCQPGRQLLRPGLSHDFSV